jgi:hypothetical protein
MHGAESQAARISAMQKNWRGIIPASSEVVAAAGAERCQEVY